jgi:hypothetical protein
VNLAHAAEQAARAPEQVAVHVVRTDGHQSVEELDRIRVVEVGPALEARARQRGDVVRCGCEPVGVAGADDVASVGMHRQAERGDARPVAEAVRVAAEEELGLDAPAVALHAGWVGVDQTGELADRLVVLALADELLPVLRRALGRRERGRCRAEGGNDECGQGRGDEKSRAEHVPSFRVAVSRSG